MILQASHQVGEEVVEGIRLIDYLSGIFLQLPNRTRIKKAIKKGGVRLNGAVVETGRWVKPGDLIELFDLGERPPKVFPMELEVVYEDEYLAVIWKPAGIIVSGNQYQTIYNALGHNIGQSLQKDALPWPQPVHRLDAPTTGLMLVAKTIQARIKLGALFENREIQKTYQAIVVGEIQKEGALSSPVNGQAAQTVYKPINVIPSLKNNFLTWLELSPLTGRTHQLRVHLANFGHPIVGDKLYSPPGNVLKNKGLFLSATGLAFKHPILGIAMNIQHSAPAKFFALFTREKRRWKSYHVT